MLLYSNDVNAVIYMLYIFGFAIQVSQISKIKMKKNIYFSHRMMLMTVKLPLQ